MSTPHSAASAVNESARHAFAESVAHALAQRPRRLPTHYLYDELGSSLFEAICRLPWYEVARTEQQLLKTCAADIFGRLNPVSRVVELGPGSGDKLITLLAGRHWQGVTVHLIDVSAAALATTSLALAAAAPALAVATYRMTYEAGLSAVAAADSPAGRTLVVFLGSNIGNFDASGADALLSAIRGALAPGDALLLGADLVKPEAELLLAYDDPLGVTAAFNRNLLVRVNRELDGDFDVQQFAHRAAWNAPASRVEMHLVSLQRQRVRVPAAQVDITFDPGETIWTESSYKYRAEDLAPTLERARLRVIGQWIERGFALTLAEAV